MAKPIYSSNANEGFLKPAISGQTTAMKAGSIEMRRVGIVYRVIPKVLETTLEYGEDVISPKITKPSYVIKIRRDT